MVGIVEIIRTALYKSSVAPNLKPNTAYQADMLKNVDNETMKHSVEGEI